MAGGRCFNPNFIALSIVLTIAGEAYSEYGGPMTMSVVDPGLVRIDENKYLGTRPDGGYRFIDESGREFLLSDLRGRPVLLLLAYYSCNGLCPTSAERLRGILSEVDDFQMGKDYTVLTLSFDKSDEFQQLKMFKEMAGLTGIDGDAWRVALFKDRGDIERFTEGVGFKYFWSERDRIFLHPNVLIFLSPEGRIVRYLYGSTLTSGDVGLAISEARMGSPITSRFIDLFNMACYSYNYKEGRYRLNYPLFIGFGSLLIGMSSIVLPIVIKKIRGKEARA